MSLNLQGSMYSIKRHIVQTHQQREIKSVKILKLTQSDKKVKNIVDHLKELSPITSKLLQKKLKVYNDRLSDNNLKLNEEDLFKIIQEGNG